jgi:hypothetical protein
MLEGTTKDSSDIVFKKCKSRENGHECLLTMEKPQSNFACNESRSGVLNKDLAKFRCNGLLVVSIFDLVLKIELNSIFHKTKVHSSRILTVYKVGWIVKPDYFDLNLEYVCTSGIHYFLTRKAAECYSLNLGYCIINGSMYGDNGYFLYPLKKS